MKILGQILVFKVILYEGHVRDHMLDLMFLAVTRFCLGGFYPLLSCTFVLVW